MEELREVTLVVNGSTHRLTVPVRQTLADTVREDLGLTGTHLGCEHGVCGACTLLVDGTAVRSCLMLTVQAEGREITTVEGLAGQAELAPLRAAFVHHNGLQCGFCTPGFMAVAAELLNQNRSLTREEVREYISGNLCRCTGYLPIIDAILDANAARAGSG